MGTTTSEALLQAILNYLVKIEAQNATQIALLTDIKTNTTP